MRDFDDDNFFWPELGNDGGLLGEEQCGRCGEWWPADHLETDSGDCITCEDMDQLEESDEDE